MTAADGDAISWFHELVMGRHQASTRELLLARTAERQLDFMGRPICTVLRPHFISAPAYAEMTSAGRVVARALAKVVDALLADRDAARQAGVPEYMDAIFDLDRAHGPHTPLGRLDGLLGTDGVVKFIEFNSDPVGIMPETHGVDEVFKDMPIADEFRKRFPFRVAPLADHTEAAILEAQRARGRTTPPLIVAIGSGAAVPTQATWMRKITPRLRVQAATLDELELRGDDLYLGGERVDFAITNWVNFSRQNPSSKNLVRALGAGTVHALWGLSRGILASAKILFEILSDPAHAHRFDAETRAVLARHIPWTRRVRACRTIFRGQSIDLLPYVAENRERFVLKPSGDLGGRGVVVGATVDAAKWQTALQGAVKRPHVIQERVVDAPLPYAALIDGRVEIVDRVGDVDPFVWNNDKVDGYLVRLVATGLRNLTAGDSSITARWILEAR